MKRSLLLAVSVLCYLPALSAGEQPPAPAAEETRKHYSFLDPVGDFVRDDILRPVQPFELVPGKDPNGWGFVLEPYVWLAGMSGKTGVAPFPAMDIDLSSGTILQNLKWGVMGAGEIRRGRWGLLADGIYMALSADGKLEGNLYRSGSLDIRQGLASLSLAYRVIDDRRGYLDVYAGARYNYLGMDLSFNPDSEGIARVADDLTNRLQAGITETVEGILAGKKEAILSEIAARTRASLTGRRLQEMADPPADLRDILGRRLDRIFRPGKGALADYIAAQIEARAAAAKGRLTAALQNRVNAAKARLSKEIATALEDQLPTSSSKEVWWVDPIVGLRGQVNLTRWLYLAAQADVGGFGAGSQITWNVLGSLGVNFTRNVFAELGYRYMYVDYDRNGFLYQVSTYGIYSSIGVKF